ncbi:hypothetical protein FOMPIDRAFT_84874 [Fomitopsis schrenkii]|uniref:Uncharacterized protein n=1 Tax=Fomitopsis schrenkii TaxID=2126942 RepID=S8E8B0_FOMSC|nr:hypothetical protein FOMPIDRAFT_84874 [Fomitopsis schrenkii]
MTDTSNATYSDLRLHGQRTAEDPATHLPRIKLGVRILELDVGCGPDTASIDSTKRVEPQGSVVGVEHSEESPTPARRPDPLRTPRPSHGATCIFVSGIALAESQARVVGPRGGLQSQGHHGYVEHLVV